jgi:hypothetical protein
MWQVAFEKQVTVCIFYTWPTVSNFPPPPFLFSISPLYLFISSSLYFTRWPFPSSLFFFLLPLFPLHRRLAFSFFSFFLLFSSFFLFFPCTDAWPFPSSIFFFFFLPSSPFSLAQTPFLLLWFFFFLFLHADREMERETERSQGGPVAGVWRVMAPRR